MHHQAKDDLFYLVYERLSYEGLTDGPGGAEYERVFDEWIAAGRPDAIGMFIRRRANAVPE